MILRHYVVPLFRKTSDWFSVNVLQEEMQLDDCWGSISD
jgi:hypothetical protein